jgi:hypothetical protein
LAVRDPCTCLGPSTDFLRILEAGKHFNPPGAVISWGGGAVTVEKYEVLVGDPRAISWKRFQEKPYVRGWQPVDAGRESDGTLYVFLFCLLCCHA